MTLYPNQNVDLERVLAYSHIKHYLRLLGADEHFAHGSRSVVVSRRIIQRTLIGHTPSTPPPLYQQFCKQLCHNDVVLTFNYDTLMEQSFDFIGQPYSLTPEWWIERDEREFGFQHVDLLKLHGSIDWYDRKYHDDAVRYYDENGFEVPDRDPLFGPKPTVELESLNKGVVRADLGQSLLKRIFRVRDHTIHFPLDKNRFSHVVPFILPLAHGKLLGHEPILDLWENMHRTLDAYSSIVIIGYSMPPHDSYAYESLGKLCVDYQLGGKTTYWGHRRVPIQIVTLAESAERVIQDMPFLDATKTRIWTKGFSLDSLDWLDWGDGDRKAA
ncbi:MAG: SIR2 family protein [Caldilineaceae bacterium]|nr:SIR2 family protein [Caldilineaceae bacterium]